MMKVIKIERLCFSFVSNYSCIPRRDDKKEYGGCLMLTLKQFDYIDRLKEQIDENDLDEKGFEDDMHVTVLYGIENSVTAIKDLEFRLPCICEIGDLDVVALEIFETENYDVLKFSVQNDVLTEINKYLRGILDYKNDYDEKDGYKAHITVAYLKKGCGKKYINKDLKFKIEPNMYWMSSAVKDEYFTIKDEMFGMFE